ncbi:hypothetical protein HN789_02525 [archaeon]|jgi:phosphate uptake regulator|nr:hypothetical protein [archaeon]MBT4021932.1 hypothetical protein [archaeon]MBT4272249.1 hypothetical protein [archaeon]MBT4460785.1 hypothetical protein [archaeon]MBT4858353.1 hypothetical protein [archaeon]
MKRKIMKIADTTYVVSIPLKWARKHGVQKGDEVEVQEGESELKISLSDIKEQVKKAQIELNPIGTKRYVESKVVNAYKKGVDELTINYSNVSQLEHIRTALGEVIGYEIIDTKKDKCIVKNIAKVDPDQFDPMLRRSFLLLLNMCESSLENYKNNILDFENVKQMNNTLKKLTTVLKRILNTSHSNFEEKLTLYLIVREIEKISNEYMYAFKIISKTKYSLSKNVTELFENANSMLRLFYEIYYKKELKKISELTDIKNNLIWKKSYSLLKTEKESSIIVHHLASVVRRVYDMHGPFLIIGQNQD